MTRNFQALFVDPSRLPVPVGCRVAIASGPPVMVRGGGSPRGPGERPVWSAFGGPFWRVSFKRQWHGVVSRGMGVVAWEAMAAWRCGTAGDSFLVFRNHVTTQ